MKSFDEWFGEASQDKLFWESPSKASKMGFEAGQQSKQAEVDELRKEFDDFKLRAHHISVQRLDIEAFYDYEKNRANRLQERIDQALIELEEAYRKGVIEKPRCIIDSMKILKGDQS